MRRGADLRLDLKIGFEDSVRGLEREISYSRTEVCQNCQGQRFEPGSPPITCVRCAGTGELRRVHQNFLGQFVNVTITQALPHSLRGEVIVREELAV